MIQSALEAEVTEFLERSKYTKTASEDFRGYRTRIKNTEIQTKKVRSLLTSDFPFLVFNFSLKSISIRPNHHICDSLTSRESIDR
jgi:hypothetical protein